MLCFCNNKNKVNNIEHPYYFTIEKHDIALQERRTWKGNGRKNGGAKTPPSSDHYGPLEGVEHKFHPKGKHQLSREQTLNFTQVKNLSSR